MERSDRGGANARAVVFVPGAVAMVAGLDENAPLRVESGKLMYPVGTRRHQSVYVIDDEKRHLQVFLKALIDGLEPSTPSLPWRCSTD